MTGPMMRRTPQYLPLAVTAVHCAKGRTLTKERRRRADRCGAAAVERARERSGVGWRARLLVQLRNRSQRLCYRMQRVPLQTWAPALVTRTSRLLCFRIRSRRSLELRPLVPRRTSRQVRALRIERAPHRTPALPAHRTYHPHRRRVQRRKDCLPPALPLQRRGRRGRQRLRRQAQLAGRSWQHSPAPAAAVSCTHAHAEGCSGHVETQHCACG